jgi:hypothetical protein
MEEKEKKNYLASFNGIPGAERNPTTSTRATIITSGGTSTAPSTTVITWCSPSTS